MSYLRLIPLLLLVGCASTPPASTEQTRVTVDSYTVLAELAMEREEPEQGAELLFDAAMLSEDPGLAERVTRLADELDLNEMGLEAATRWQTLAPNDDRPAWFFGIFQTRLGQYDAAIDSFLELIGQLDEENHGPALALVMEALLDEPNPGAGTRIMTALADTYPDLAEGRYALARLAFRSGDFELALNSAAEASELAPDWVDAKLLYARTLLVAGRTDDGLSIARSLVEKDPTLELRLQYAELLLSAGENSEAKEILNEIITESPGLAEATRALAFLALSEEDLDEAERYFEELRGESAYRNETFYYLGRIAETRGDQLQATRAYARVTEGNHAVEAQLRTARIMFDQTGDPDAALQHLAEFGAASPQFATQMLVARGQILVQIGRSDAAMDLIDSALEEAPGDEALTFAQVQLYLELADQQSSSNDLDAAERLLSEGLRKHPGNLSIRYAQALLFENQGRMRKAATVLERLVEEEPTNPAVLNAYGYLLTDEFDRHDEAADYIRRALAMDSDNAAIIDSMGWVLFHLGQYEAALDYLERAARLVTDPEMLAHLIDVHWKLGNREIARQLLDSSLAEFPDSRHLIEVEQRIKQ
jgi:tetratricopeptide (TPR) repeat protein